jgi:hypothetical protein
MSFDDKHELDAWIAGEALFPNVTGEAVRTWLKGFNLPLNPSKNADWLAKTARRVLAITLPEYGEGADRVPNKDIRKALQRRRKIVEKAWLELFANDVALDRFLWDFVWQHWEGEMDGEVLDENEDVQLIGELPMYARYKAAIQELDWLGRFLRDAANSVEEQGHRWKETEQKVARVERARYLAPVFEAAFGAKVTVNNYPNDARHREPTPFGAFYQHMVSLAFDEHCTPNLPEVLRKARAKHRVDPVTFPEGIIPDA